MDTNILLENGTNELEVLEFTLNDNHYGINVAKIREILSYQPVTPIPNAQPQVEGIFMPRDAMITVINLKKCLSLAIEGEQKRRAANAVSVRKSAPEKNDIDNV